MKKKTFLILALVLCGCVSVVGIMKIAEAALRTRQYKDNTVRYTTIDENYIGADFSEGEIAYRLDKAISANINTFECWIRIDENTEGRGVIFGSYCYYNDLANYDANNCSNWEYNADGKIRLYWGGSSIVLNGEYNVKNSEWTHVAVVRDEVQKRIFLYINGEQISLPAYYADYDVSDNFYRHRIGGDSREGQVKYPFQGEIGQITCYSTARTAEEIKKDYQEYTTISHESRGDSLLFNTMLQIGDTVGVDTSDNCNNARLITNDYYYEGELYPTADYSFAVLGDTQKLTRGNKSALQTYTDWFVANRDERKISAVFHVGDMTDGTGSSSDAEWNSFWDSIAGPMKELRKQIPLMFVPGNHDYAKDSYSRDLTRFNQYFPYSEIEELSYFKGAYQEGQTQNTYYYMDCGGVKYVVIALEFGADSEAMEWACDVMKNHSDCRVILLTHGFLDCAGEMYKDDDYLSADWYFKRSNQEATSSLEMWEKYLCKQENLFMILCGHSVTESIAYKELKGDNGNTVMAFRIDPSYIVAGQGLDSVVALFTIDESESKLYLNYYSIDKDKLYNIQNQMEIDFSDFTVSTDGYYD